MRRICIIPARGGSKRLPKKNILPFHGKPIIQYSIEAAVSSGCFDCIVVSSDDNKVLEQVADSRIIAHLRDSKLASDEASVVDVCIDILNEFERNGDEFDHLCVLYATAPMRNFVDIQEVISLLDHEDCKYAIAATHYMHYAHQALQVKSNRFVEPMWPDLAQKRASAVGELIAGNGSTYAVEVPEFMKYHRFYGPGMRCHLMPFSRSIDIDTSDDWKLAEIMYGLND